MLFFFVLSLLLQGTKPPILRVEFDLQIVVEREVFSAELALYQLTPDRFAIHCRKPSSGTLFHYWATPTENILEIPREGLLFRGESGQHFQLFPRGPGLDRAGWLALLLDGRFEESAQWLLKRDSAWNTLFTPDLGTRLLWRERRRVTVYQYKERVLLPDPAPDHEALPFEDLIHYWREP